ncbi:MAG TPA: Imm27 family immunity protein [Thermoanaerobaculia bacterium]
MRKLGADETELVGSWLVKHGRTVNDDVANRIEWLTRGPLRRIATDASGWDTLFEDPGDGRLWERIYPASEMHGGGPPLLRVVSPEAARTKYGWHDRG